MHVNLLFTADANLVNSVTTPPHKLNFDSNGKGQGGPHDAISLILKIMNYLYNSPYFV